MEESLKFNSQICTTKEQSQRLLELGLKPETADMSYYKEESCLTPYEEMECPYDNMVFPAWSLHRLLCMLDYKGADTFNIMPNFAYEDIIATISFRINYGIFNKEYLKQ